MIGMNSQENIDTRNYPSKDFRQVNIDSIVWSIIDLA